MDVLVPDEYREIMVELCEKAPESSFEDVKETIESSFNAPLSEIFKGLNFYNHNYLINFNSKSSTLNLLNLLQLHRFMLGF